jgi:hypothetical protein
MDDQESLHTRIASLEERNRRLEALYETAGSGATFGSTTR